MKHLIYLLLSTLLFSCDTEEENIVSTPIFNINEDTTNYAVPQKVLSTLALGDSYTIGASVSKEMRWNEQLKEKLQQRNYQFEEIKYIAQTGWTTSNLLSAIDDEDLTNDYDIVTLLIGVNNQYQRKDIEIFRQEYEELLQLAIQFAGNDPSKVIVLSIPDYGYTYTFPSAEITQEIDQYNSIKASISGRYNVVFHNITSFTRQVQTQPELIASDGLHPSGKLYELWVNDILDDVYEQFLVSKSN